MAVRRPRSVRRASPYPPRDLVPSPSISKFTPINGPIKIPPRPVGGPKRQQWGLGSHEALRHAPIGSSTVRMLVGDTTPQVHVSMEGTDAAETNNIPPGPYDVDPDENAYGLPDRGDLQYWTQAAAAFIRSSSGLDATWVGRKPLGQGSFGVAGVWEKFDENGMVVDTVVIKQIGVKPKDVAQGVPWDSRVPHEVVIMKELNETNCDTIVRFRAYKRYPRQRIHRIYLEYCPYGDLRKLYKRYRQFRRHLPETYLWETFRQLLKAVSAMHFGPLDENNQRIWNYEIVHRDFKPQNVFLGNESPLTSDFPFYPTAKVGDFGLAERTNGEDPNNPQHLQGAGTRIYMAPEQKIHSSGVPDYLANEKDRLGHGTNLWAVGATMYELLTLHHAYGALYPWDIDEDGEGVPVIRTTRTPEYSAELRQMIRMCLRPDPSTRPDFEQLYADVNRRLAEIARASRRLRGNNLGAPHQEERLYYRGNEINTMQIGDWTPTHMYVLDEVNESGFRDPYLTSMRFPIWNRRPAAPEDENEDEYSADESDPDEDVKRIMADSMLVALGTGATVQDDVTMGTDRTNNNDDGEGDEEMEDDTTVGPAPTPQAGGAGGVPRRFIRPWMM